MNPTLNLLIVDDDQHMTRTLADILRLGGHEVVEAASGADALKMARAQAFDCALTDIRMPEMDGVELHRQLRKIQPGLPVMLMTAYAADSLTLQGLEEGVVGVLDKPLDINHLLGFLTSLSRNRSIVIVDDDKDFCESLGDILRQRGFKVTQINDPKISADLLTADAQLILLDLKFDGISGVDVLKDIRKNNPSLPVLLVTGYRKEMDTIIRSAMEINAFACLYKPLEIPQLLQMLSGFQTKHLRSLLKNS